MLASQIIVFRVSCPGEKKRSGSADLPLTRIPPQTRMTFANST